MKPPALWSPSGGLVRGPQPRSPFPSTHSATIPYFFVLANVLIPFTVSEVPAFVNLNSRAHRSDSDSSSSFILPSAFYLLCVLAHSPRHAALPKARDCAPASGRRRGQSRTPALSPCPSRVFMLSALPLLPLAPFPLSVSAEHSAPTVKKTARDGASGSHRRTHRPPGALSTARPPVLSQEVSPPPGASGPACAPGRGLNIPHMTVGSA